MGKECGESIAQEANEWMTKHPGRKSIHWHNVSMFTLRKSARNGRLGSLALPHGTVTTPAFLPVATAGAMKGITLPDLASLGAEILLCNTYHLHLNPGGKIVKEAGGLHAFIGWDKPILTDSGGYQVFSLKEIRTITSGGVHFRDHRSGARHFLGPIEAIRIQHALGADIIMCFDECPPSTAAHRDQLKAVDRTLKWAKECKNEHERIRNETIKKTKKKKRIRGNISSLSSGSSSSSPLLFGIVQGGLIPDLRKKCAEELIAIGFDGYAIGGLAVGETEREMYSVLSLVCPILPKDKPRYLMGVGDLRQMKEAIRRGIDLFDCVAPMREARHGNIWLSDGTKLRIRRSEYAQDHSPIDPESPAPSSRTHKRSYLHHLLRIGERYGETIACLQNMAVTLETIRSIRTKIEKRRS